MNKLKNCVILGLALALSGCKMAVLDPHGIIAATEKQLLIDATLLMLIVVIPVIILSFVFAWKYRASRINKSNYKPEWAHSNLLEAICWGVPCIIIGLLAVLTWIRTHSLDPYHPIVSKKPTMTIQVVALDWKWLFIYPQQHIATLNYMQIPVNVPVRFYITADAPMNSFAIPELAGQIYAMPGMRTTLYVMANRIGQYTGMSANFSGNGFAAMNFDVKATSEADFNQWVKQVRRSPRQLTSRTYNDLVKPSENVPVGYFSSAANGLFNDIIAKYMKPAGASNMKMAMMNGTGSTK